MCELKQSSHWRHEKTDTYVSVFSCCNIAAEQSHVIPAEAGIQHLTYTLDPRLRGDDGGVSRNRFETRPRWLSCRSLFAGD